MNLIDEKERAQLLAWAKENQDDEALNREAVKKINESYFKERMGGETCIMKYYFSTVGEIEEMMSGISPEIRKVINIAILKNKPQIGKVTNEIAKQDKIPECIYVF